MLVVGNIEFHLLTKFCAKRMCIDGIMRQIHFSCEKDRFFLVFVLSVVSKIVDGENLTGTVSKCYSVGFNNPWLFSHLGPWAQSFSLCCPMFTNGARVRSQNGEKVRAQKWGVVGEGGIGTSK